MNYRLEREPQKHPGKECLCKSRQHQMYHIQQMCQLCYDKGIRTDQVDVFYVEDVIKTANLELFNKKLISSMAMRGNDKMLLMFDSAAWDQLTIEEERNNASKEKTEEQQDS